MNNDIEQLIEPFRTAVKEMIKRCKDIPGFRITETIRTLDRQKELYRTGYSKTLKSKHLIGEACDVYVQDWDMSLYNLIYEHIKDIPYIIWPYKDLGWNWDGPHFELDRSKNARIITSNQTGNKESEDDVNKEQYELEIEKLKSEKTAIIQEWETDKINRKAELLDLRTRTDKEIEKLRGEVTGLRQDLEACQKQAKAKVKELEAANAVLHAELEDKTATLKKLRESYKVPVLTARDQNILIRLLKKLRIK